MQKLTDGTFGQVVIDDDAAARRQFRLLPIGSKLKVLSSTPSMHHDKFGGSSPSI